MVKMVFHTTTAVLLTTSATVAAQDHLSLLQTHAAHAAKTSLDFSPTCQNDNSCHGCYAGTNHTMDPNDPRYTTQEDADKSCRAFGTDFPARKQHLHAGGANCYGYVKYGYPGQWPGGPGEGWTKWQWNGVWDNKPNTNSGTPENTGAYKCDAETFGGSDPAPGKPKECWCCGSSTRPCQIGENGCPKEKHKAQTNNLKFACSNIDDAEWAQRVKGGAKPSKDKKCRVSEETKAELAAARAARKAAKKALKEARAALKAAKANGNKAEIAAAKAARKAAKKALKEARAAFKAAKAKAKAECAE